MSEILNYLFYVSLILFILLYLISEISSVIDFIFDLINRAKSSILFYKNKRTLNNYFDKLEQVHQMIYFRLYEKEEVLDYRIDVKINHEFSVVFDLLNKRICYLLDNIIIDERNEKIKSYFIDNELKKNLFESCLKNLELNTVPVFMLSLSGKAKRKSCYNKWYS